ncbi:MAG: MarR family transcriptional regulator [Rhodobacteraceae bacterium]|nr:MAG: MarR family transcriptional regulator [Paracoccaceae bacterium]
MQADALAALLVHLGRAARSGDAETAADGMTAAQWAALRYFAQANAPSRTPSAFASFHATSRGTASQTVKALVARGLLARTRSGQDGRSVRLEPTAAGRAALAGDPMRRLVGAIEALPAGARRALSTAAARLVAMMDGARGESLFGFCPDCESCVPAPGGAEDDCWCLRHGAALAAADLDRLCADFTPRADALEAGR